MASIKEEIKDEHESYKSKLCVLRNILAKDLLERNELA